MFKTLFTVEKKVCESTEFTVLFEDYGKAKEFAFGLVQNLTEKEDEDFTHWQSKHLDGSMLCVWFSNRYEISIDDNAWITDYRTDGIRFHDCTGLVVEFENKEDFKTFLAYSQKKARIFS